MKLYDYDIELTDDEVKYKYVQWLSMGVTYANPPDYNASRSSRKSYINIDYEFEKNYYMNIYNPKKK